MSRGKQKKLAVINDMTCFGRCALTVSIPIISAMKLQCCPLPTALFSNHTAYPSFFKEDFTKQMSVIMEEWKKLGLEFEGILIGYLGSAGQMEVVQQFVREFSTAETIVTLDPVMGDNGRRYPSYTEEMSRNMQDLVGEADLITPNLTECCLLTDAPYLKRLADGKRLKRAEILEMGENLLYRMSLTREKTEKNRSDKNKIERKKKQVVISGIPGDGMLTNLCLTEGEEPRWLSSRKVGTERCGTGDVFAAIVAAGGVLGMPLEEAVEKAARFIGRCMKRSEELEIPLTDGICLEEFLSEL